MRSSFWVALIWVLIVFFNSSSVILRLFCRKMIIFPFVLKTQTQNPLLFWVSELESICEILPAWQFIYQLTKENFTLVIRAKVVINATARKVIARISKLRLRLTRPLIIILWVVQLTIKWKSLTKLHNEVLWLSAFTL